ncbi:hypothetical protein OV203_26075 [Nannocystis sp. ILAH1]|uniref:hypothetical protein n=1 Tax=Nannocystis sp. ILAH1 TaxID=2996789 RepID=UPI00226EA232|nr:hypothetical protein [Nannocystis sp. ILAH1]MCY0990638.1 hypothetical protein [Nannocystis sp. ILAH1]
MAKPSKPPLGPKLGPDEGVPLIPASEPEGDEDGWGVASVSLGMNLDLDPAILVDRVSRALLTHHREAILAGVRPDGGGQQKALSGRALAAPGRQSDHRGYRTGFLADNLRRSKIQREGDQQASTRILPPPNRNVYLAQEAKRGVLLLTLSGRASEVAREAASEATADIVTGRRVRKDEGEKAAKESGK